MSSHIYTRDLVGGAYNINNPLKVNLQGEEIPLYKEINDVPEFAHKFNIKCDNGTCTITFNFDLSAPQILILDGIVTDQKTDSGGD